MSDLQRFLDEHLKNVQLQRLDFEDDALDYDIFGEIAESLAAARMEEGLTQGSLARRCGISQANISKLETGSGRPSISTLKKLADGLGRRLTISFAKIEGEE